LIQEKLIRELQDQYTTFIENPYQQNLDDFRTCAQVLMAIQKKSELSKQLYKQGFESDIPGLKVKLEEISKEFEKNIQDEEIDLR
jgi:hypothetical protein